MTKEEFRKLTENILILDGATGSNLMASGMPRGICTETWVIDHKDIIQDLQRAYIQAGSQVIYAPTFGGNSINLEKHGLRDKIEEINRTLVGYSKELESKMNANAELQKQIVNYAKTRAVYVEYRKAGYSKKFRSAHEADILLHQAAKKYFDELGITKLPSVKSLREEYAALLEQKRKAYSAYKQDRDDMKELHNVRANVEYLLEIRTEPESQRSTEKDRH